MRERNEPGKERRGEASQGDRKHEWRKIKKTKEQISYLVAKQRYKGKESGETMEINQRKMHLLRCIIAAATKKRQKQEKHMQERSSFIQKEEIYLDEKEKF